MLCVNLIEVLDDLLDEHGVSVKMDVIYLKENAAVVNDAFRCVYHDYEVPMYNIVSALDPYTPAEVVLAKVLDAENRESVKSEMKELMSSKSIYKKSV